jgi:hypothetical protein
VPGGVITAGNLQIKVPDRTDANFLVTQTQADKSENQLVYNESTVPMMLDTSTDRADSLCGPGQTPDGTAYSGKAITDIVPWLSGFSIKDASNADVCGHNTQGSWRAVPGDTVSVAYPVAIALQGDNLVADLTARVSKNDIALPTSTSSDPAGCDTPQQAGVDPNDPTTWTGKSCLAWEALSDLSMTVYTKDGYSKTFTFKSSKGQQVDEAQVSGDYYVIPLAQFQADTENAGADEPNLPKIDLPSLPTTLTEGDINAAVVVTATFDQKVGDDAKSNPDNTDLAQQDLMVLADDLVNLQLTQTRTAGAGNLFTGTGN